MSGMADVFMQWMSLSVTTDATDSTDLVEESVNTGISIAGDQAMAVHQVEIQFPFFTAVTNHWDISLSTLQGLLVMPNIGNKGCICHQETGILHTTTGTTATRVPEIQKWLPPFVIAAPQITAYAQTFADAAAYRGQEILIRIGYTFVPITSDLWRELFQTWNAVVG